jgi:hypothetical protein
MRLERAYMRFIGSMGKAIKKIAGYLLYCFTICRIIRKVKITKKQA